MDKLPRVVSKGSATGSGIEGSGDRLDTLLQNCVKQRGYEEPEDVDLGNAGYGQEGRLPAIDIPDSFDLKRYDICDTWGLEEWTSALISRWRLRLDLRQLRRDFLASDPDEVASLQNQSLKMLDNPAYRIGGFDPLYPDGSPIWDETIYDHLSGGLTVDDPRYEAWSDRFHYALTQMPDGEEWDSPSADESFSKVARDSWQLVHSTPSWKVFDERGDFWGVCKISVNLGASDESLIREFKAWIKKTRKARQERILPKDIGQEKFEDWHRLHLLPYLDLTFWAEVNGGRIPYGKLGEILFSDELSDPNEDPANEGRIRKSIHPYAQWIVSESVIGVLKGQSYWSCKA